MVQEWAGAVELIGEGGVREMKYFMQEEYGEMVFPLDEFKDRIYDGEKEITLLEMERDYGSEMWCKEK